MGSWDVLQTIARVVASTLPSWEVRTGQYSPLHPRYPMALVYYPDGAELLVVTDRAVPNVTVWTYQPRVDLCVQGEEATVAEQAALAALDAVLDALFSSRVRDGLLIRDARSSVSINPEAGLAVASALLRVEPI